MEHIERQSAPIETQPVAISRYLDASGRVAIWPAKRSLKLDLLAYLAHFFTIGRVYSEKEVNELLSRSLTSFSDYATVRRDMCDAHYLGRERDGSRYWRIVQSGE